MSNAINPEAAEPTSTQAYEQSDRNPAVTNWSGIEGMADRLARRGLLRVELRSQDLRFPRIRGCKTTTSARALMRCRMKRSEKDK
jgi:hypothetical protein